ncbi:MAG: permease [Acidobacteria bacterium]|nr:permease [Acidobacteriota bacterium]
MLDTLLRELRFSLRTLLKAPSFTAAVVATIGLAVGATTAMFAVVDGVLLRPLPFAGSGGAVALCETNPSIGSHCGASPANVADWDRDSAALERAGVARTEPFIARGGGETWGVRGGIASPGFFEVLRLAPALGRLIEERDMRPGANRVALLGHAYWEQRLGADPAAVGRAVTLDDEPFTVIGVLPAGAYVPGAPLAEVEVWKPLTASVDDVGNRSWRGFTAIGRVAGGASRERLEAELATIRARLASAYPEANRGWGLRIVGLREQVVGGVERTLWIFFGAVAIVLLIACANVASLLLVRATARGGEFAVRAALGAGRAQLARQLVVESLVLSLGGGLLGLLLAAWATSAFVALAPGSIPRLAEVQVDLRVAAFAFALAALTALLFSAAPARLASRCTALQAGARVAGGNTRLRSAFVVAQVALALTLLFGAGLLARGFGRLLAWDPGFDRAGLVTSWMLPPASTPVFGGEELGGLTVEGRPAVPPSEVPAVHWFDVSPEYFDTLGVRLVRGRRFTAADGPGAVQVSIVNETLARRIFGAENPLGRRIVVDEHASEIVGVVGDTRPLRPDQPTRAQVFWPIRQYRRGAAYLVIRTAPGVAGIEAALRARAAAVNAGIQLTPPRAIDEWFARELVAPRFNVLLVLSFAAVALLLGAVGVYGVIAYALASRMRELGVRVALGATPRRLMAAAVGHGMALAAIGIAIGCLAALPLGRVVAGLIFGLSPRDPLAMAAAAGALALAACLACWIPARRASRVDPIAALRVE